MNLHCLTCTMIRTRSRVKTDPATGFQIIAEAKFMCMDTGRHTSFLLNDIHVPNCHRPETGEAACCDANKETATTEVSHGS